VTSYTITLLTENMAYHVNGGGWAVVVGDAAFVGLPGMRLVLEEALNRSSAGDDVLDPAACGVQVIGGELARDLAGFA
jgi:hypothetical protein